MKNLFKMTTVLVALSLMLSGCNCFKKMAKNADAVSVSCTPEVLTLNNGKISVDVKAEFPAKYFNKNATLKVTPVLASENSVIYGEPVLLQGEKVAANGLIVKTRETMSLNRRVEFAYKPEMQTCNLLLLVEAKCKNSRGGLETKAPNYNDEVAAGKYSNFVLVDANSGAVVAAEEAKDITEGGKQGAALANKYGMLIAKGVNTLQSDIDFAEAMVVAPNNYKRVTNVTTKADIVYRINSSKVAKKAVETAELQSWKQGVEENKANDRVAQSLYVKGYASPDGPEKFNDKLSKKRSETGLKAVQKLLADAGLNIDAAAYGEDWEGFQAAVAASNIEDKDLILQVLKMYTSSADREKEIKNMANVFKALKTEVLPKLRRAQVVNSADITGWSDAEMIDLIKAGKASTLNVEELLHIATVCDEVAEAALVQASKSGDARAWNNLAVVYAKAGNYEKALACLNKANKSVAAELTTNYALCYAGAGNTAKADSYAKGATAEAQALVAAAKGDYTTAAQNLKSGYNAAIAQLQNGNLAAAKQSIASDMSADADYLRAIIACRQGDLNGARKQLNSAISKDASLKAKAAKDINLAALK